MNRAFKKEDEWLALPPGLRRRSRTIELHARGPGVKRMWSPVYSGPVVFERAAVEYDSPI
jgi:hypothetical protein